MSAHRQPGGTIPSPAGAKRDIGWPENFRACKLKSGDFQSDAPAPDLIAAAQDEDLTLAAGGEIFLFGGEPVEMR